MTHPWDSQWEVVKRLGAGGQGLTDLVRSKASSQDTGVLKRLRNNRSAVARARMRREVANLQSLASLGGRVPNVLDHNTDAFERRRLELFLVMEFIDGPTLKELLENEGKRTVDRAIELALDLCETVKTAHTEGILHRDIKPENIVLRSTENRGLYIVDYGLSFNAADDDLTEAGETFRNKFLDLPETNTPSGDRRDPRSDVTALCAIFYYLLTGHHPGQLQDESGRMPHLRPGFTVRETIPSDARMTQLELVLSRGLAPQLQNRFQNVDDFTEGLVRLQGRSGTIVASDPLSTAEGLSLQLRERDRKTQIAEFRLVAKRLLSEFANRVNSTFKQLGRFTCEVTKEVRNGPGFENGLVAVPGAFTAKVAVDQHRETMFRVYQVAARGEQCIVCVCDYPLEPPIGQVSPSDWREVAWYEGTPEFEDVIPALEDDFKEWLDGSLEAIANKVLEK